MRCSLVFSSPVTSSTADELNSGSPYWHWFRLSAVRGFAGYLHAFDGRHQVPRLTCWPAVTSGQQRPGERFMVRLRIGEALGLRRSGLRLLPGSRCMGCAVVGAHVRVRHLASPDGTEVLGEGSSDMVFVSLCHEPAGAPMTYRAAKRFFERVAGGRGFPVRARMFRHTAATSWVRAGTGLDVVRDLLGAAAPPQQRDQYLRRLRETLRACQFASRALAAAGRTDPGLGPGDFTASWTRSAARAALTVTCAQPAIAT